LAIGNWGTDIIFRVSDKTVLTFQNLNRTVGAEWATHSRVGKKDQTEFLRPKLQKITFSIYLDALYGVRPRATLDRLADYCETGTVNPLVVGGKRVGRNRWKITDLSEAWDTVMNRGELVRATVSVTMEEYL
jgi:hypothetical protein